MFLPPEIGKVKFFKTTSTFTTLVNEDASSPLALATDLAREKQWSIQAEGEGNYR